MNFSSFSAVVLVGFHSAGHAFAAAPVPSESARLQATARFLAGLPTPSYPGMEGFVRDPGWVEHALAMDRAWTILEKERLEPMRGWSEQELKALRASRTVLYPFGGPDSLHLQVLHPWAERCVLLGLEPVGSIPELGRLAVRKDLAHLRTTLRTAFQSSFFITRDMERDFKHPELRGVLPVVLAFQARLGHEFMDIEQVDLDGEGRPVAAKGKPMAARIRYRIPGQEKPRELWYIRADLSNYGLHRDPRILAFIAGLNRPHTFLKSASYLLHRPSFTRFREALLKASGSILQDDTGIPQKHFDDKHWKVQLFGTYQGPIALFKEYAQADLAERFQDQKQIRPLAFGMGYRHHRRSSNLALATPPEARPGSGP
jgi:hypothetical protein